MASGILSSTEEMYDALGFLIPANTSPQQRKYLLQRVEDQEEFLRIKRAETNWMKLINEFNSGNLSNEQVRRLTSEMRNSVITNSIPASVRSQVYLLLCGITEGKLESNTELFNTFCNKFLESPELVTLRKDIEQDLHRTFPEHKAFFQSEKKAKDSLFRVLGAFALHQPTIGYCQSLNFVAAFFLIIFNYNEPSAFSVLEFMVDNIMNGYYSRSLLRIVADMSFLENLIEERHSDLHTHLKNNGFSISLVAPNWFMSGFTNCLPAITAAHLWDWVLLDKDISILFRIALGILSLMEKKILEKQGTNELVEYLRQPPILEVLNTSRELMTHVHQNIKRVPVQLLLSKREEYYEEQRKEFHEFQTRKELILLSRTTHFRKEQIEKLKVKFMKLANEDGYISSAQFESLLQKFPATKNNPELIKLYLRIFDKRGTQVIEFTELVTGLSIILHGKPTERLRLIFELNDPNRTGYLGPKEVTAALKTIYKFFYEKQARPPSVKKFVKVLFESLDTNKDGKLSFQEFEKALLLEPKLARCFVPQTLLDNSRDGSPKRVRSEMRAPTPSTTIESVNTQSVINLIPMLVEKEKVKKSREELLAAITNTASTSSVTQSHAVLGTDSQSTGCFCIVQ